MTATTRPAATAPAPPTPAAALADPCYTERRYPTEYVDPETRRDRQNVRMLHFSDLRFYEYNPRSTYRQMRNTDTAA